MKIRVGDRFIKTGSPYIVWTVTQILDINSQIPHVVLVKEASSNRQITLSVPALETYSMYTKLD